MFFKRIPLLALSLFAFCPSINAFEKIILNEYNTVSGSKFLKDEKSDVNLGRIEGNGGNWIELVVIEDFIDIRGLELWWAEETDTPPSETIWDETRPGIDQGIIKFSENKLWSSLRSGTIITIAEKEIIKNEAGDDFITQSDTSFSPSAGDWWIHVWSGDPDYITTVTNVSGDEPGNFSVGNDDWEIRLVNASNSENPEVLWGPVGEAISGFGGSLSSREVGKLEFDPGTEISIFDYNDGSSSSFGSKNIWSSGTISQNFSELRKWADSIQNIDISLVDGSVSVSFERRPGRSYTLQASEDITSGSWQDLTALPPVDSLEPYIENLGPIVEAGQKFYRLLISSQE